MLKEKGEAEGEDPILSKGGESSVVHCSSLYTVRWRTLPCKVGLCTVMWSLQRSWVTWKPHMPCTLTPHSALSLHIVTCEGGEAGKATTATRFHSPLLLLLLLASLRPSLPLNTALSSGTPRSHGCTLMCPCLPCHATVGQTRRIHVAHQKP
jgi:hypothetical protein